MKLIKSLSVSGANQAVSSLTSLGLILFLARHMGVQQFGAYGIAFAAILLHSSLLNAALHMQVSVRYPSVPQPDRMNYLADSFWLAVALSSVIGSIVALTIWCLNGAIGAQFTVNDLIATIMASIAYSLKDFVLRAAYSLRKEHLAFAVSSSIAFTTALLCGYIYANQISPTTKISLYLLASSQLAGVAFGLSLLRIRIWSANRNRMRKEARANWLGGKWSLAGAVVIWLQSQAYVIVAATIIGTSAVATANAARIYVSPLLALLPAIGQVMLPRFAEMSARRSDDAWRFSKVYVTGLVTASLIYITTLYVLYPFLPPISGEYAGKLGGALLGWGLIVLAQASRDSASIVMQSLGRFRSILAANVVSAAVTITLSAGLAWWLGVFGSLAAIAVGEMVLAILLWRHLRIHFSQGRDRSEHID